MMYKFKAGDRSMMHSIELFEKRVQVLDILYAFMAGRTRNLGVRVLTLFQDESEIQETLVYSTVLHFQFFVTKYIIFKILPCA